MRFVGVGTVILAGLTATLPALASAQGAPGGRFSDFVRPREGGVIPQAPRGLEELDATDHLRLEWESFRERHGDRWNVYLDERTGMPTLAAGDGIEWFPGDAPGPVSLEAVAERARAFLEANARLLGEWSQQIELDAAASTGPGAGRWQLVFRQVVDGVRVENSRLEFHIDAGRLTMFGASYWGAPTASGVPTIDSDKARDLLDAYLRTSTDAFQAAADPQLVLMALDADPGPGNPRRWTGLRGKGLTHALVWRLQFHDPETPALWVAEIDAHDGAIRAFYDGAHYGAIRGGVFPQRPNGDCDQGGCEIDDFPMPYAGWTEPGQDEAFTDGHGNLVCSDPAATFETTLRGTYVQIDDICGPIAETAGCEDTLSLDVKAGENCDVADGTSPGNTAAARSAYYHINRAAEVARFHNPDNPWLNGRVTVVTNWDRTCNASWGGSVYLYRSGSVCANSGEISGIAVHEWGHGYDENDGGGYDSTSEAYGDVVAIFASRESCFGPGFFTDGRVCSGYGDTCLTCTGFRDLDWAARQANTPATPREFVQNNCGSGAGPCGGEVHCEAYPIGEAIYDLATRDLPAAGLDVDSAWQLAERLWYSTRAGSGGPIYTCALPDSDSCAASSWYQRLRSADDDDADLSNGTPHAAELYAAFARHDIACGLPADAENQSTSSCPSLAAPVIALGDTPAGTQVSWADVDGAAGYVVYRGELGCNRQQVPLTTVPYGQPSYVDTGAPADVQRFYRVEAFGANPVCRSAVSACEATLVGPRLQKNGHRMIESGAHVNLNGFLDPGETVQLPVTLFNGGDGDAFGVRGRLRTVDPAQGRVIDPVAVWPDMAPGAEFESDDPHFELTLFESGVACGEVVTLEVDMDADGAATRSRRFEMALGTRERDFVKTGSIQIPRLTPSPITSTLEVVEDETIGELDVSVSITHANPAELIVELTSPMGTTVRLHDNSAAAVNTRYDLDTAPDGPGQMADFAGEPILGTWTVSVQDTTWGAAAGSFNGFTLHVTAAGGFECDALSCSEPPPDSPATGLVVERVVDGTDGSVDLQFSWDGVPGAAGYHVLRSGLPTFGADVDLIGRTDGAPGLTVEDGATMPPALSFFQVRAANVCNEESP